MTNVFLFINLKASKALGRQDARVIHDNRRQCPKNAASIGPVASAAVKSSCRRTCDAFKMGNSDVLAVARDENGLTGSI